MMGNYGLLTGTVKVLLACRGKKVLHASYFMVGYYGLLTGTVKVLLVRRGKKFFHASCLMMGYYGLLTGTVKVSSIWNSAGFERSQRTRVDKRLRNILSRSRFSPVTLDTWNTGHILQVPTVNTLS